MLKKFSLNFFLIIIIIGGIIFPRWQTESQAQTHVPGDSGNSSNTTAVQTTISNENELQFTLNTPVFINKSAGELEVTGLDNKITVPGSPALPFFATYIAVPPGAEISIQVQELAVKKSSIAQLRPSPQLSDPFQEDEENWQPPQPLSYLPDPAIYEKNAFFPENHYSLTTPMYYRDLRLVQLSLYPLRYNPVTGDLHQAQQMRVNISFIGTNIGNLRPLSDIFNQYRQTLGNNILNFEQARDWRSLPANVLNVPETPMPIGSDVYKIEVNEDGIYAISGADLAAAGMNISAVNPSTIEMMYRGEPVAYKFEGDGDNTLESNEIIQFFGWAFDGPRAETRFITDNVLWLWSDGSSTTIPTVSNEAGQGHELRTSFPESITRDTPEQYHFHTRTNQWNTYPNDADDWYMDRFSKSSSDLLTRTYTITLPYPAATGPDPIYLIEIMTDQTPVDEAHVGRVYINNYLNYGEETWGAKENVNISNSVPLSELQHNVNDIHFVSATDASGSGSERLLTNRVTVDYTRQLIAIDDQLIFNATDSGAHEFQVAEFSEANAENTLVWDISNPLIPVQIDMNGHINPDGGNYTYQIGRTHDADAKFIATTHANLLTNAAISQYIPPNLNPTNNEAEWIAITHADFTTPVTQLAAHRANSTYTNLKTHVVDIEDVINQYGYGLPLPSAIRNYLTYALGNWNIAPRYVLLVGDATFNPRHLSCDAGCQSGFDPDEPIYVVTDLVFEDPYQGLIPSDHTMVLLSGSDLLPDMAVGRIPAQTVSEASSAIDKIIQYEQTQTNPSTWSQHSNLLFVADNPDSAGDFCAENHLVSQIVDDSFNQTHLCLDLDEDPTASQLRLDMKQSLIDGLSLFNYRGHGSPWKWGGSPTIMDMSHILDADLWENVGQPVVTLSADCLDGYFTYSGKPGLGETLLKLERSGYENIGSAAHWSSTGLGTTYEHTILHSAFYEGLFRYGTTAIGDATNYAKLIYHQGGFEEAELYSFTLQGDPAMQLFRPDLSLNMSVSPGTAEPGDTIIFTLDVSNEGLYPAYPTINLDLTQDLDYINATSAAPINSIISGTHVIIDLLESLPEGDSISVTVSARVNTTGQEINITNQGLVHNPSLDLNPNDNSASTSISILRPDLVLDMSGSPTIVDPGDSVRFDLIIENRGTAVTYASLINSLPEEFIFDSAEVSMDSTTIISGTNIIIDLLEPLAEEISATVTITSTIAPGAADGIVINHAVVNSSQGDVNLANNDDSVAISIGTTVTLPDLNLNMAASQATAEPEDTVAFEIQVHNGGFGPSNATIIYTLPPELDYIDYSASIASTDSFSGTDIIVELLQPLAVNDSATVTITTTVKADTRNQLIINEATAVSSEQDLNPDNNSDSTTIFVYGGSQIYLPIIQKP